MLIKGQLSWLLWVQASILYDGKHCDGQLSETWSLSSLPTEEVDDLMYF